MLVNSGPASAPSGRTPADPPLGSVNDALANRASAALFYGCLHDDESPFKEPCAIPCDRAGRAGAIAFVRVG
jgi:hypothetical protein